MRRQVQEPLTINAEVVADLLEQSGRRRMAAFVRYLDEIATNSNRVQADLRARLAKYETYTLPEPMPSARSEWD